MCRRPLTYSREQEAVAQQQYDMVFGKTQSPLMAVCADCYDWAMLKLGLGATLEGR